MRRRHAAKNSLTTPGIWRAPPLRPAGEGRRNLKTIVLKGRPRPGRVPDGFGAGMDASVTTAAKEPEARAEALIASYERAGYAPLRARHPAAGGALPRPLRRGHPQAHVSDHRARRRRILPAARSHHSGVARLSRLAAGRPAGGLLLSRPGVPPQQRRRRRIPAGRHRDASGAPTRRRPTPRCWRSAWKRPRITAWPQPDIRIGDVALFVSFIAGLDLPPAWKRRLIKDFNRKSQSGAGPRPPGARRQ